MVDHATLTVRSWLGSAEVDFTDGHHPCNRTATGSRLVRDHAHRHFRHDHSELRPRPRRPSLPPQTLRVWGKGRFAPLPQNLTQVLGFHPVKTPSERRPVARGSVRSERCCRRAPGTDPGEPEPGTGTAGYSPCR